MDHQSVELLIQKASGGSRSAMEALLEQQLPQLRAFIRLRAGPLLRRQESSSDVLQSVCREVLADLPKLEFRGELAFKKWLYVATLNKLNERKRYYLRDKRDPNREQPLADDPDLTAAYLKITTASEVAVRREETERLQAAFDELPEDYREVITCARLLGMAHAEIAERMGRSEGAVRVLLSRAVARLGVLMHRG
jgi:RNA polymerase sigma-70 factor (ECF subfamily)